MNLCLSKKSPADTPVISETQVPPNRAARESKKSHFSLVCVEDEEVLPALSSNELIKNELKSYSNIRVYVNEYSCPLEFYQNNEKILPNMAKIANGLFRASECLFSTAGNLISEKRSRLHPECAQDLLMLNKNKFD